MLLESFALSMCLSVYGPKRYDACQAAITAASIQSEVFQKANEIERVLRHEAKERAINLIGSDTMRFATGVVYVYQVYRDQHAIIQMPGYGIAQSISMDVTKQSYSVKFSWSF